MQTPRLFMAILRASALGWMALAAAACGDPGTFAGTYEGTLSNDAEPRFQTMTTVVIGPSTGTPDMNVQVVQAGVLDCAFDANRSGGGATAAMIPRGGCDLRTANGQLVWSWSSGMVTHSGAQLGLSLTGTLSNPYAPTSRAAGDTFLLEFNGGRQP